MKKVLKAVGAIFLLLLVAAVIFFFWASSPNLDKSEYSKILTYAYGTEKENDSIFSIVTYNIGYLSGMTNNKAVQSEKALFDKNLEMVLTETKKLNPDIIALQEIDYDANRSYHVNQETEIATLGYNYVARGINWDETYLPFPYWPPSVHYGKVISGQSILSKYPIKDYERLVLDRVADSPFYRDALYLDRLAQVCKITLNGKEVVVINVHLEAFDKQTRVQQFRFVVDALFNKYKNQYPTILLGDFNAEARSKDACIQELITMDGIGNAAFTSENIANTFNTKNPYQRIDYIFYTKKSIEYIDGKVVNELGQASDHLPVYMQFSLKRNQHNVLLN